ncbi:MAG: zf-HC2 domain-containing protein, partial [bacterium]|nr:zf-HC2 domain-containing protein [bacterium]
MSCRRAFDIDLAAFLAAPRDAAWDAFRAHYPTCPACAAEVAAWTELGDRLGADAHPEPALLLRWAEARDELDPGTRRRLARHLDGCPGCSEELRALARFD